MLRQAIYSLNGKYYQVSMQVFMIIVALHFLEHVVQVTQLWLLHWPRPMCMGLLGSVYPWMMKSEWLHYGHALFMLLGLAAFRLSPIAGFWWSLAMWLAFYHHFEHALLLSQAISGENFRGSPVPISIGQIWFPRIELHLFYNLMILVPMLIAFKLRSAQSYLERDKLSLQ